MGFDIRRFRDNVALFPSLRGRVVPFLLFFALCLGLLIFRNPEIRVLLLVIDAIGLDVFLLLVLIQLQAGFAFLRHAWVEDARYRLCRWGAALPHWRAVTSSVVFIVLAFVVGLQYVAR